MKLTLQDKRKSFPGKCMDGRELKPITQVILDRRATSHFKVKPLPDACLEDILQFGAQAPSGENLQPGSLIDIRDKPNRQRLQMAAYNQEKIGEAPVVIIAFGIRDNWKEHIGAILLEGIGRGYRKPEIIPGLQTMASYFLGKDIPQPVWINRHTMIAVTIMMLMAEAYGFDTAPMEGFDPHAVAGEFGLPESAEIVALLAIALGPQQTSPTPDACYYQRWFTKNTMAGLGKATARLKTKELN